MKKHLLLTFAALAFLVITSRSQVIQKGNKIFGGNFGFSISNNSGPVSNPSAGNAAFTPSFGWAIGENMVLGLAGTITYDRSTYQSEFQKLVYSSFKVAPGIFLKKYKPLRDRFGVYFNHELDFFYAWDKQESASQNINTKTWSRGAGYSFTPGVYYKFSERFLGEGSIGAAYFQYQKNGDTKSWKAGVDFLQSFRLGIGYVIGKNRHA